jgi:hypothetical protein
VEAERFNARHGGREHRELRSSKEYKRLVYVGASNAHVKHAG